KVSCVAGAPEEIPKPVVSDGSGLKLRDHLASSDDAAAIGQGLAVRGLKVHWIGKDDIAAAIVIVLGAMELGGIGNAIFESVVGSRERFANERRNRIRDSRPEKVGGASENALVEQG